MRGEHGIHEEEDCPYCKEWQSKLDAAEKRLKHLHETSVMNVVRERDEALSRLDRCEGELRGASDEIEYQAKLRKEVEG